MSNYIIDSLEYNLRSIENIKNRRNVIVKNNEDILNSISKLENMVVDLKECKGFYSVAVNELYELSIKALKDTLDYALQSIIYDRNLSAELVLDDKRGAKTLSITLLDNDTGYEVDVKEGTGMGFATIISFVLKLYYLDNKNSNILILDEKYSNVSVEYTPKFFEFMRIMCTAKKFTILLVSHDERFMQYADNIIQVSRGCVTKLRQNEG